jgi:hypothetical protein
MRNRGDREEKMQKKSWVTNFREAGKTLKYKVILPFLAILRSNSRQYAVQPITSGMQLAYKQKNKTKIWYMTGGETDTTEGG